MKFKVTTHPANSEVSKITNERLDKFEALQRLLESNREAWTREHPDQWVAVGTTGIEASSVDFDQLLETVGHDRILANDLIIELLETNPVRLAL